MDETPKMKNDNNWNVSTLPLTLNNRDSQCIWTLSNLVGNYTVFELNKTSNEYKYPTNVSQRNKLWWMVTYIHTFVAYSIQIYYAPHLNSNVYTWMYVPGQATILVGCLFLFVLRFNYIVNNIFQLPNLWIKINTSQTTL